jgi:hypothetical protein
MFSRKHRLYRAMFRILKEGHDFPALVEAAYSEVFNKAYKFMVYWRLERLARTWKKPDARYIGITLLADLVENAPKKWLSKKAKRSLEKLARKETHPRNLELIKSTIESCSLATGAVKYMGRNSIGSAVARVQQPKRHHFDFGNQPA